MTKPLEKYKNTEGDLGQKLSSFVEDRETDTGIMHFVALDEYGKCPLLDKNGLCEIVINKGEDYLSHTCKIFPRCTVSYSNITEHQLNPSCPVVAEYMFRKKQFELVEYDDGVKPPEGYKNDILLLDRKIRGFFFEILKIRAFPLALRQLLVLDIAQQTEKPYSLHSDEGIKGINAILNKYSDVNFLNKYAEKILEIEFEDRNKFNVLGSVYDSLKKNDKSDVFCDISSDLDYLAEEYVVFKKTVFPDIEHAFENLSINELYNRLMEKFDSFHIYANTAMVFLELAVIKYAMFVMWINKKHVLTKANQIKIISVVSRYFANNKSFMRSFYGANRDKVWLEPQGLYFMFM